MNNRKLDIALYTEGMRFTGDTLEREALGDSESAFIYLSRELADRIDAVDPVSGATTDLVAGGPGNDFVRTDQAPNIWVTAPAKPKKERNKFFDPDRRGTA